MDVELCTGEPGGDVNVLAAFTTDTLPPLAAGDRVVIGGSRYVLLDADWVVDTGGFTTVRFYVDKADSEPGGLGEQTGGQARGDEMQEIELGARVGRDCEEGAMTKVWNTLEWPYRAAWKESPALWYSLDEFDVLDGWAVVSDRQWFSEVGIVRSMPVSASVAREPSRAARPSQGSQPDRFFVACDIVNDRLSGWVNT